MPPPIAERTGLELENEKRTCEQFADHIAEIVMKAKGEGWSFAAPASIHNAVTDLLPAPIRERVVEHVKSDLVKSNRPNSRAISARFNRSNEDLTLMQLPIEISYRGVDKSDQLEEHIRSKAARLDHFCDHISRCDVVVEHPNHSQHSGNPFRVRIDVTVPPGHELVAEEKQNAHECTSP